MVHRADVLKDREWALNGRTFRWPDKAKYQAGTEVPRARHSNIERHRSAEGIADRCMSSKPNHSRSSSSFSTLALGYLSLHQVSDHLPRALHEG